MLQTRNDAESGTLNQPLERLHGVINAARKAGADAAEAVFAVSRALSVGVRKGEIETVERDETADLGLRVFVGRKLAVVSVSEFSEATLARTVERGIAMAKLAPDDPYASLADPARLYRPINRAMVDLQVCDNTVLSPENLKQRALDIESAGLAVSPALQSDAASAGYAQNHWTLLTSEGFEGSHDTSLFFQSGRFIATDADGNMERDGEGRSTRYALDLPDVTDIGRTGAERALAALGARKVETQKVAVLFDRRVAKSLISQFLGAISGSSVARGSSFLKTKLGQAVFAPHVQITDNPFRMRGLGSCLFDDEGVATRHLDLVKDGVLTTWLLNTASARQLGLASTGHASRSLAGSAGVSTHNVVLAAGPASPQDLMRDAVKGVVVTSMFGPSVNSDTGDWSAGASGFWFDNGEIQYPVNEITVAGNLIDMYARLVPASDLEIRGTIDAPGILIDGLSVGGK
ncbi:TldD/PmbA family protein [Asticcacaulis sp. AC402]|uniref:TldD/PmbA family protein n=1 Tax=Asticcacaulis sp. AC402 TaxID=1282361 RepID=UPI0003C40329|nr:TldD/PmbA family protein [Asticcacaulis sp. AC402]ESQ73817.1 modulator protein [Asticcacaulis sp. AC402]